MRSLSLSLLGPLQIGRDGRPISFTYDKVRALLAYLAVESDRPHRRDTLAELLWPDQPAHTSRHNLSQALTALRQAIGDHTAVPPFLLLTRGTVQFDPASDHWLDVAAFAALLDACDRHPHHRRETCAQCAQQLEQAVGLYRGEFLEQFSVEDSAAFEEWALLTREQLRQRAFQALVQLSDYYDRRGDYERAGRYARRQIELDPWREEAHRQLMRVLALSGQRGAALAHYERCRGLLAEELGLEPEDETVELYEHIRGGELRRDVGVQPFQAASHESRAENLSLAPPIPSPPAPASQLPLFLDSQAEPAQVEQTVFIGRERELSQLDGLLQKALAGQVQVAFVIGEAGQGKTSLLHEFARQAQADHLDLIVASGVCDDYTSVGDPLLPFRDVLKMLSGDVETQWAAGAISRDHALRLWRVLPHIVQALVEHGPDLVDTFIPGTALADRAAANQTTIPGVSSTSGYLNRLQELVRQKATSAAGHRPDQNRIFEEYTAVLEALAGRQPLLLILDDLHWADLSSIGLLSHLSHRIAASPLLIVGAYRPEDVAQGRPSSSSGQSEQHPLEMMLSEFKRHFGNIWVNLDQDEPARGRAFVDALLDSEPNRLGEDFRRELARHTEGQPLFTSELLRDLQERGNLRRDAQGRWVEGPSLDWNVLPLRVEGVIEKCIGRLDAKLREILTMASVEGETFTAEVIARARGVDERDLIEQLSSELVKRHRLLAAQGVQRLGAQRLSRYQFRHNLFQKYLYDSLDEVERAYRHELVGNALEALYGDQAAEIAVVLARHFQEARIPPKAIDYLYQAGDRAIQLSAHEEAVGLLGQGLALLETLPEIPEHRRQELKLRMALGEAQRKAGQFTEAMETFQRSADIARALGSPEELARAALGYEESRWRFNQPVEPVARLLAEALNALGEEESVLKVRVWVSLVRTRMTTSSLEQFAAMSRQALEMARRVNDPLALYDALYLIIRGDRRPEKSAERIAALNEMVRLAQERGDRQWSMDAYGFRLLEHLELGDLQAWQADYTIVARLAKELRQPEFYYGPLVDQTMLALLVGRFEEAERLAQQSLDIGRQMGVENVEGVFGIQIFTIRREQGRLREAAPVVKAFVERNPAAATWRPGLALIYSELGLRPEARAEFEFLAANDFAGLPQDALWVICIAYLSEVCAFLGDTDRAATLYRLLLPYAGRTIVVGFLSVCYGAAARYLGLLATTMSCWAEAERHFEEALKMNVRLGARPWLAHTQHQYAAMLLARGRAAERDKAMSLLDQALETARDLGMISLIEKIAALTQ